MRPAKLTFRFSALFLAITLALPASSSWALRTEGGNSEKVQSGLEEALKDPQAALNKVARLITPLAESPNASPPPAVAPFLSPSTTAGLEEFKPLQDAVPLDQVPVFPSDAQPDFRSAPFVLISLVAGQASRWQKSIEETGRQKEFAAHTNPSTGEITEVLSKVLVPVKNIPGFSPQTTLPVGWLPISASLTLGGMVVAVVGHQKDLVMDRFGRLDTQRRVFYVEQTNRDGTGGAVWRTLAAGNLRYLPEKPVIITAGDQPLLDAHVFESILKTLLTSDLVIGTSVVENPKDKGRVIHDRKSGQILDIVEQKDIDKAMEEGKPLPQKYQDAGYKGWAEVDGEKTINTGVYGVRVGLMDKFLSVSVNDNAQKQYYATAMVPEALKEGKKVVGVDIPAWKMPDVTRIGDLDIVVRALKEQVQELKFTAGMEESDEVKQLRKELQEHPQFNKLVPQIGDNQLQRLLNSTDLSARAVNKILRGVKLKAGQPEQLGRFVEQFKENLLAKTRPLEQARPIGGFAKKIVRGGQIGKWLAEQNLPGWQKHMTIGRWNIKGVAHLTHIPEPEGIAAPDVRRDLATQYHIQFAPAEERNRKLLELAGQRSSEETAVVLGMGRGYDIPLLELALTRRKIALVDLDEPSMQEAVKELRDQLKTLDLADQQVQEIASRVSLQVVDISGIADRVEAFAAQLKAGKKKGTKGQAISQAASFLGKQALDEKMLPWPLKVEGTYDLVVSSFTVTQVFGGLIDYIRKAIEAVYGPFTQADANQFLMSIQPFAQSLAVNHAGHLRKLVKPGGKVYFSTEVYSETGAPAFPLGIFLDSGEKLYGLRHRLLEKWFWAHPARDSITGETIVAPQETGFHVWAYEIAPAGLEESPAERISPAAGVEEQKNVTRREFLKILASAVASTQTGAYQLVTSAVNGGSLGVSVDPRMHQTIRFLTGVLASRSGVSMEDISKDPRLFLSDYWQAHRSDLEDHGQRSAETSYGKHLDSRYSIIGHKLLHDVEWAGVYTQQQIESLAKKIPTDRSGNPPYYSLGERAHMGVIKDVDEWVQYWTDFLRGEIYVRNGQLKSIGSESVGSSAVQLRKEIEWITARSTDLERFAQLPDENLQLSLLREGYQFWLNRLQFNLKSLQPLVQAKVRQVHIRRLQEERRVQETARRDLRSMIQSIRPRIPPGAVFIALVPRGDTPVTRGVVDDWNLLEQEVKRHPGLKEMTLVREELSPGEDIMKRARAVAERFNLPGRQLTVGIALGVVSGEKVKTLYHVWPTVLQTTDPLLALSFIYTSREKLGFGEQAPMPSYSALFTAWASDPAPGLMQVLPRLTLSEELWKDFEGLIRTAAGPPVRSPASGLEEIEEVQVSDRVLAIELGGTWIRAALVDARSGDILVSVPDQAIATPRDPQHVLGLIAQQTQKVLDQAGLIREDVGTISVSSPGDLDEATGFVTLQNNLPFTGQNLQDLITQQLGGPALISNDMTTAVRGEALYGGGRGRKLAAYLTVSTGTNAAYWTSSGKAVDLGLWGYQAPDGQTVEENTSGVHLARRARERISESGGSRILQLAGGTPEAITAVQVGQAFQEGNPLAVDVVENAARALGRGIGEAMQRISSAGDLSDEADVLWIVGGGVAQGLGQPFIDRIQAHAPQRVKVVLSRMSGSQRGLSGAAARVREAAGLEENERQLIKLGLPLVGEDVTSQGVIKTNLPPRSFPTANILLIPSDVRDRTLVDKDRKQGVFVAPPFGIYRIKMYLESKGVAHVDVFDPNLYPEGMYEALSGVLKSKPYDIIGFGPTHINMRGDMAIVDFVKKSAEALPGYKRPPLLVGGGSEITENYGQWLKNSPLDLALLGYGERVLEDVATVYSRSPEGSITRFNHVPGVVYMNDGQLHVQYSTPITSEFFTEVAYTSDPVAVIPYERYWDANAAIYSEETLRARGATRRTARLFTSSHCPNGCGFCSSQSLLRSAAGSSQVAVLRLNAQQIADLVKKVVDEHKADAIYFNDDDFVIGGEAGRGRIKEFARLVKQMKARGEIPEDFKFYTQTRARSITVKSKYGEEFVADKELLDLMKEAGFALVAIGVETFSDRLSNQPSIKKKMPAQMAEAALNGLFEAGIIPLINIILLPPETTEEDILITADKTLEYVARGARVSMQTLIEVYPGAPMATQAGLAKLNVRTLKVEREDGRPPLEILQDVLPTDDRIRAVAVDLDDRSNQILSEFQRVPGWNFRYPPQPVPGLTYLAAVLEGLGHRERVEQIRRLAEQLVRTYNSNFDYGADLPSPELLALRRLSFSDRERVEGALVALKEKGTLWDVESLIMMHEGRFFYDQALSNWVTEQTHLSDMVLNTMTGILNRYYLIGNFSFDPVVVEFLKRFGISLASRAPPSAEAERLLALLNFHFGITTDVLRNFRMEDGTAVNIVPRAGVIHDPKEVAGAFKGRQVLVVEEHHDDAALYMGNLIMRDVVPNAGHVALVTATSDPLGVTNEYAEAVRQSKGIPATADIDLVKKGIRENEGKRAAQVMGVSVNVSMKADYPVVEPVYSKDGKFLSYLSKWQPFSPATYRRAEQIIEEQNADTIIIGLPRVAFHQAHRDVPRLFLNAAHEVNKRRVLEGRSPIEIYFYIGTNPGQDPFAAYGIKPNVLSPFGPAEQEAKQRLIALYPSQLERRPSYGEDAKARDARLASSYLGGEADRYPYVEALLSAELVGQDGKNVYDSVKVAAVEDSVATILKELEAIPAGEEKLLKLFVLDNNVLYETKGRSGFIAQRASSKVATYLAQTGVMSVVIDGTRAGDDLADRVRVLVAALAANDAQDLLDLATDSRTALVKLEVFSGAPGALPAGAKTIVWKEAVHEKLKGKDVVTVGVHQGGYHRYLGVLEKIAESDIFVLADDMQFVRSEWQNRQQIGKEGHWLTVPVEKGHLSDSIADKRINNSSDWKRKHMEQIRETLSGHPFYKEYAPFLEELYRREWTSVSALNEAITRYVVKAMGLTGVVLIRDSDLGKVSNELQKGALLAEIIKRATAGVIEPSSQRLVYVSGKGAHYLEEEDADGIKHGDRLRNSGIQVDFQYFDPDEIRERYGINPLRSGFEILAQLGSGKTKELLSQYTQRASEARQKFTAGLEEFAAYLDELKGIRRAQVQARGAMTSVEWQIEQLALDYTGQPPLVEETALFQQEESLRAQELLKWIYREPETRDDFKRFVATHPVTHTFRNRISPVGLVISNYLSGRAVDDREILRALPSELLEGNETIAQHPWFGHGAEGLPQAPILPKPAVTPEKPIRVLVVGAAEKVDPSNSSLRYLKAILEHTPTLRGYQFEITGNDIVFQEQIRRFDKSGQYKGVVPGIQFAADGSYTDPETGIALVKIKEGGKEDPLTEGFQPRDAGLYDVVLVSRVSVQFFGERDRVALLRKNAQKYLNPTGLLLFDDEYADHLELIRSQKGQPEPTTIPYLDNTALERRIERLPVEPKWKPDIIRAHRLAERFADLERPVVNRFWEAWRFAQIENNPQKLIEILTADVPKLAVQQNKTGLEELRADVKNDVTKIAALLSSARVKQQTLVGIGPSGLESDGPALIEFLDRLKDQVPAVDPFLIVIGQEAPLYRDHRSVLLAAGGLEEAAGLLALLGAGRMAYLDTTDGAETLNRILQVRGVPITVAHLPLGNLTFVLKQILGNLAGLEENLSQSEVEAFYGVSLNKLADHLKKLAQVGV